MSSTSNVTQRVQDPDYLPCIGTAGFVTALALFFIGIGVAAHFNTHFLQSLNHIPFYAIGGALTGVALTIAIYARLQLSGQKGAN